MSYDALNTEKYYRKWARKQAQRKLKPVQSEGEQAEEETVHLLTDRCNELCNEQSIQTSWPLCTFDLHR